MHGLSRIEMQALKAATRRLVEGVGGIDAAAAACRLQRAAVAKHYSPNHPETMPIDVVAELERAAGILPVTAALARLARHAVVPIEAEPGDPELLRQLAELMRRVGLACAHGADAMADNVLTPDEKTALEADLHDVVGVASALIHWLHGHPGPGPDGGPSPGGDNEGETPAP